MYHTANSRPNGRNIDNVCNWGVNGATNHNQLCQKYNTMRAGLSYNDHDHKIAVKRLFTIENLLEYLAENVAHFSPEELCRNIIPVCLKPKNKSSLI